MKPDDEEQTGTRSLFANSASVVLALVASAVAAAFFVPWFNRSEPGGALLARYSPLTEGGAHLTAEYDAGGAVKAWASQNEIMLPPALALSAELRKSERDAINKFFLREGETGELSSQELIARIGRSQIYHSRGRRLLADGQTTDSLLLAIRNERADFLVSLYDPATDAETLFDPPIPILQADLAPGQSWTAVGKRIAAQGTVDYRYSAKVAERGPFKNEAGHFAETLKIETRLVFTSGAETLYEGGSIYWLAPGLGAVESQTLDSAGKLQSRSVMFSGTDQRLQAARLPALAKSPAKKTPAENPLTWDLSRFGSTRSATDNSESSVPATWIPTDPPMLLAARYGSGLTAFNASEPGAPPLWRFQTGGSIYGQPTFDPEGGRIYFGASDKQLYALDPRGLFLWSFQTGDNIVTRPVVVDGAVIFGSEDRSIYILNADSGAEVWHTKLGGAVVSSPVVVGDLVIFGCDDGGVYALDPKSKKVPWRFPADDPVEAPIAASGGRVFAGTHSGDLYALDPANEGKEVWSAHVGGELRTAPAIADGRLYIVSGSGRLCAYDVANGRRLWSSDQDDYIGPPVLIGETLIVGGRNGDAHAVDLAGRRQKTWPAANASSPSDGTPALRLAPSEGGGAIWFADTKSVIRRLSPPVVGPIALRASWMLPFTQEPLTRHFMTVAPVAYREQALIIDSERDIFLLDPSSGKGARVGAFGEKISATMEPTVAGDTLLASAGTTLYAVNLPGGTARWKFDGQATASRPATVAGDSAFWLTQRFPPDVDGKTQPPLGKLYALDLATGGVRWQRPLGGFTGIGGALVSGATLLTSAPAAAFDLASGEPRWQAQITDSPLGGGALNETGDTFFIGLVSNQTSLASIAALRTADGSVLWRREIGDSPLHPFERPWLNGSVLVVPLWSGDVIGLAAADGVERWRHKPAKPRYGGISVAAGRVWFAQNNARVVALDAVTGQLAAQLALDIDIGNIPAFAPRPLLIDNHVVAPLAISLLGVKDPPAEPEREQP